MPPKGKKDTNTPPSPDQEFEVYLGRQGRREKDEHTSMTEAFNKDCDTCDHQALSDVKNTDAVNKLIKCLTGSSSVNAPNKMVLNRN